MSKFNVCAINSPEVGIEGFFVGVFPLTLWFGPRWYALVAQAFSVCTALILA